MQRRQLIPVNQGRIQHFQRHDPFRQIQQMMMGIGGLNNDPILSALMINIEDPFSDIFKFSDIHKNVHSRGVEGSYVMQSFVSSTKMGSNGEVITESYFENNLGQHRLGNTISQKQQAYKNSSGVNRIAQQRMLNDRGRKIIREKRGNDIEQTNHYYNIDEQEAGRFDSDWRQTDRNMKFLQSHQRILQQVQQPRVMQIGHNGPQYYNTPVSYTPAPQYQQIQNGSIRERIQPQRLYQAPSMQRQSYQQPQQQSYIQQGTQPQLLQNTLALKIPYGVVKQNNLFQNGRMYRER